MNISMLKRKTLAMTYMMSSLLLLVFHFQVLAQGFSSITTLSPLASVKNTGEKPQSKVWTYDGKWFSVFPNSSGTYIWRLDGTAWTSALKISSSTSVKADCKVVDNVCHILLWRKETDPSQLVSVEYVSSTGNYKLWSKRVSTVLVALDAGVETATIDIDGNGRMWLASDGITDIRARWSDYPYTTWSAPIIVASGITDDDISDVVALPLQGQVGIFWSNQNTKRFGFKTHNTADAPSVWGDDEVPASQSALNIGGGMSDDHLNIAVANDGVLYCAVKTSYDTPGYAKIGLLKRQPNGAWDDLYQVSEAGTRAIVILNEATQKLKIIYTSHEDGGDILYQESPFEPVSFSSPMMLISGFYNNPTSSKATYATDIVILASNDTQIVGVLADDTQPATVPEVPTLLSPSNFSTEVNTNCILEWNDVVNATSYRTQVSNASDFSTILLDQTGPSNRYQPATPLAYSTSYYWRVQSLNSVGSSEWSSPWTFTTVSLPPDAPALAAPADSALDVSLNPVLAWNSTPNAVSYNIQLSLLPDFSSTIIDRNGITTLSFQATSLAPATTYFWRVQATNGVGSGDWSLPWSFKTILPAQNEMVAWWAMEDGGTLLTDQSNFHNDAHVYGGASFIAGVSGQAIRFNGSTQYALVDNAPSLNVSQGITIAAWIRPERKSSQHILEKGNSHTMDGYELSLLSTGKVSFSFNQRSSSVYKVNSKTLYPTDGTWIHVAATFNGTVAKIFVNGVENKSVVFTPVSIGVNNLPVTIGRQSDATSFFKGSLDEVRIYNYPLNGTEVKALYSNPSAALTDRTLSNSRAGSADQKKPVVRGNTIQIDQMPDLMNSNERPSPSAAAITVYPNPVYDKLFLELPGAVNSIFEITISDTSGNTISRFISNSNTGKTEVDIGDMNLHPGLHILRIRSAKFNQTYRFIKK